MGDNAYLSTAYKVVRDLIFQQISAVLASFFTHKSGEEPLFLNKKYIFQRLRGENQIRLQ
ncbi:hypothetical protein MNBD_GAMMA10-2043 [hydrothermal vent metagenome]|uniref:Uncharacterized protein n=1 Tax=hydrothermal vent metagenome TaxID=652676 RepID=A0A3B0XRM2_9ZZZZ